MKSSVFKTLWPDTLFTRMVVLIAGLLILGQIAIYGFLHTYEYGPRSQRLADLWAQTLVLASAISPKDYLTLQDRSPKTDIIFASGSQLPVRGHPPQQRFLKAVQLRLQARLGNNASILVDRPHHKLWLSWKGSHPVTLGLPMKQGYPVPLPYFKLITLLFLSLLGGFLAARQISRPLRTLVNSVTGMREGHIPEPMTSKGPLDIRELTSRFNHLLGDINALIRERELVLVGVSHDLRTPLTRIRLASEFLSPKESETRDEIIQNVREMDAIIEQFISYARDGQEEIRHTTALDPLIAEVIERSRTHEPKPDIQFIPGLGNYSFPMQPVGMSRLVRNLIDNAIEHGAPPVFVETRVEDHGVILTVRDQGSGIPDKELNKLPHAFVHGAASGGIGFGLAIVTRIARNHGGQLTLVNPPEGGFEARVSLPLEDPIHPSRSID